MKHCNKCGETKPTTEFSKSTRAIDGLHAYCKACASAYSAKWRASNAEKKKADDAAWCAANQERRKATNAAWRAANQARKKAYDAAWRAANADRVKANNTKWQEANTDKVRSYKTKWQAANPESRRIAAQNRRARKLANGGKLSADISERLYKLQKGKCACGCKQPLGDNYHRDHIMPLALGGTNTDDNIQLLRSTCNHQKGKKHPVDFMQQKGFLI